MTPARPADPPEGGPPGQTSAGAGASDAGAGAGGGAPPARRARAERRSVLLRLDPAVHEALARWASDELRSVNAQIDMVLRRALDDAGRLPRDLRPARRPGRPARPSEDAPPADV